MKVYVDTTEPGVIFHALVQRGAGAGIEVARTLLHKRRGNENRLAQGHPFYGWGADYVVTDAEDVPCVGIERKTSEDLARSIVRRDSRGGPAKVFRQLRDVAAHPTPILLVEGSPGPLYRRVEPAIVGLQFWCARQGIALMTTTSPAASAEAILSITRKLRTERTIEPRAPTILRNAQHAPPTKRATHSSTHQPDAAPKAPLRGEAAPGPGRRPG